MKKILSIFTSRMFITFALVAVQAWFLFLLLFSFGDISWIISLILEIASIFVVIYITNKRQNPAYKISWIILILIIPVFGVLMYFLFSQPRLGKAALQRAEGLYYATTDFMQPNAASEASLREASKGAARQSDYISKTALYPLYTNTQAKFYPMGQDFYADLLVELEKAEKYIFMEYFIVHEGKMWNSILDILKRKVAAGVEVRFMYDDLGCISTLPRTYYKKLRAMGIQCHIFNPVRPVLNSLFNNRDHRKITVIDGKVGFCGGANLADEYINEIERFGTWKDAAVMLQGEGVRSLLMMFLHLWTFSTGDAEADFVKYETPEACTEVDKGLGFVQPFADVPFDERNYVSENVYMNLISRAEDYIYINTPYLILDNELTTVLCGAAKSGVDVRITVPHIPDKKMVFLVTQANYPRLIEAGVRIYEYTPGFIHSKTAVCDDKYGIVGTVNLDFRSLYLHFECGVWMYKTPILADIKQDFLETIKQCTEITPEHLKSVPWYKRFIQAVLKIFGPMM